MRIAKIVSAAALLITTAIVGGTLIGSVLGAPGGEGSSTTGAGDPTGGPLGGPLGGATGEYCDVYLDTFAAELGVSRDDLLPAGKAAAIAAIDAAVANGDLTQERADQMKERIEGIEEAGCGFLGGLKHAWGRGFGHGFARGFVGAEVLDAAATALGLESADLITAFGEGTSLEEMATQQGVSYDEVKAAVLAALDADLDAAVAEGMAQEHADRIRAATERWLDNGGEPLRHRWGGPFRPN
jgi:hypothetical protein